MPIDTNLLPILLSKLRKRLTCVQSLALKLNLNALDNPTAPMTKQPAEENLRKIMIVFLPKIIKKAAKKEDYAELLSRLLAIKKNSLNERDLRYFDAWNAVFEATEGAFFMEKKVFLSHYEQIISYHIHWINETCKRNSYASGCVTTA